MQLTPNYNLKKPEGTDPVDIQDFNDNADLIDAALKKKAESSGGDISGMTVKTLDDITTEFPVPVAGESTKTFLGKVKKFFSDTKNWMTGVCLIGQIVNNCVTNNAKLPLSAAQGKVLMDLYNVLNTNLTERFSGKVSDCNFLTYGRSETVVIGIWDNNTLNTPYKQAVTGFGNGFMIGMSLGIEWSIQIAFAVSDTNIFVRSYTLAGVGWTGWRAI